MSDEVEQFRTLLTHRFGWRLDHDHGQVAQVLASRLRASRSPADYLAALALAPRTSAEARVLAETFAVSETYFFRNPEQFAALADVALPRAAAQRPAGPLRILSAGSASGEEAYSVAMTVRQARLARPMPPVDILGLDVSPRVVERARRGRYSAWALRGLPASLRTTFFHRDDRHFDIRPDVRAMVTFREWNLIELRQGAPGPWDIVFFRNTLMYFTPEIARMIVAQIAEAMPPGGTLFLGHAETLRELSDDFELQHSHDAFYYVRRPAASSAAAPYAPPAIRTAVPEPAVVVPIPAGDQWFHDIARASERIAILLDRHETPSPEDTRAHAGAPRAAGGTVVVADVLALFAQERYPDALAALGNGTDPEHRLLRAVLLVNMGRLDEARAACAAVLAADSLHAGAHYVQALCEERDGNEARAIRHDDMAIYLDEAFAMPHLHLALLARQRGDRRAARRHARCARELLPGEADVHIVLYGNGFGRTALIQLCDAQLRAVPS